MAARMLGILESLGELPSRLDKLLARLDQVDKSVEPIMKAMSGSKLRQYINTLSLTGKQKMEELGWNESNLGRFAQTMKDLRNNKKNREQQVGTVKESVVKMTTELESLQERFDRGAFMEDKKTKTPFEKEFTN